MQYFYIKAIHIIFVVTWFAGLFYLPRLLVYLAEVQQKQEPEKSILTAQLLLMTKRLWYGITWPSAVLTLIFGGWMWWLYPATPSWLWIKLAFVLLLYVYHFSLQVIVGKHTKGLYPYSGNQMRIWNEVPTVLLVAVVMLVVVKESISLVWGIVGLAALIILLMSAIRIYKIIRQKKAGQ
ncbi:MAG TPA: CopD family protein [Phnomibacter sp.]|nr:CopD family protein [Phnomibacter sp.]